MTITEAFNELFAACEDNKAKNNVANLLGAVGVHFPVSDDGPDFTFVQSEFKVLVGMALVNNKTVKVSEEAANAFKTGYHLMLSGKPAEGVSDAAMDKDIDDNLDML